MSQEYQNREKYFNLFQSLLTDQLGALEFQQLYSKQSSADIDINRANNYTGFYRSKIRALKGDALSFYNNYFTPLCLNALSTDSLEYLHKYEKAAIEFDVDGEIFFLGIDCFISDLVREFTPRKSELFDPEQDIDEEKLLSNLKAAYEILQRNKDRWW